MVFQVQTNKQVWKNSAIISAISIAAPVAVVDTVLSLVPGMPRSAIFLGIAIAFLIPLLIAPPLSFFFMTMLRVQDETIRRVDDNMRFDMLTGVLNRGHFLNSIRSRAAGGMLMIVDADHFKQVNDRLGHAAGDEALVILAQTMQNVVGIKGLVGRLGGEEFGIFLPGADVSTGMEASKRLCEAVRSLDMIVDSKPLKMTISIGGTLHHQHLTIGHSLKVADDLLYKAKHEGRDRFALAGPAAAPGMARAA